MPDTQVEIVVGDWCWYPRTNCSHLDPMPVLKKLAVRIHTSADTALPALCAALLQVSPPSHPELRMLIFSVLQPVCALEDLLFIFEATARRAGLGYPLQHLIVCRPRHVGPDYSARDVHGAKWVTFSSSDAGPPAPGSIWGQSGVRSAGSITNPVGLWGRSEEEYAEAWVAEAA
ncbi:hypothetical protein BD414DRAFT_534850 [Trametes punicea]|nr:hypothetical protein BD414DRAFT_534850 [Trametes punicea]